LTAGTVTALNLQGVIEEAIQASVSRLGGKQVMMVAEYPAHLPAVLGDRSEVIAIISSAAPRMADFALQGEVRVRAELRSAQSESGEGGPTAVISISILPGDQAARILQREIDETPSGPSTGMLSLGACRQAVLASGGAMWLEPDPSGRLRLCFSLPVKASGSPSADVSSLRDAVRTRLPEGGGAHTLLLMVDDPEVRQHLARDLAAAGYRLVIPMGGEDVLSLARRERPNLILLDLLSRDPSAYDIAMVLKQDRQTRGMPVLFLTSVEDPERGRRVGTVDFVVRPAGTGALVSTIETVLSSGASPSGRVLVIEPTDRTREMIILMIQHHGYRASEASGPEEGLVLAERVHPDLVLVNAEVAQERDYWLLRNMRLAAEKAEIVVIAEVMSEAEGKAAMRRGASGYSETGKLPDLLRRAKRGTPPR
jgi:DNA-binding response OmpR family regulator